MIICKGCKKQCIKDFDMFITVEQFEKELRDHYCEKPESKRFCFDFTDGVE